MPQYKVESEYKFHPKRNWKFDFAIPELKIAVEIEGGIWTNGRHTRGAGYKKDMEKYNYASLHKWQLFRYEPVDVNKYDTYKFIIAAIKGEML